MGRNSGHTPIRTCVSCRSRRNKKDLIPLKIDSQGVVFWDAEGKHPGRGAYVCRDSSCMERLRKGKALSKAFRRAGPVVIGADLLQIMGVEEKEE